MTCFYCDRTDTQSHACGSQICSQHQRYHEINCDGALVESTPEEAPTEAQEPSAPAPRPRRSRRAS